MISLEGNPVHILQETAQWTCDRMRSGYLSVVSGNGREHSGFMFIRIFGMFQKSVLFGGLVSGLCCVWRSCTQPFEGFLSPTYHKKVGESLLSCFWGMPDCWSSSLLSSPYLQVIFIGKASYFFFLSKLLYLYLDHCFFFFFLWTRWSTATVWRIPSDFQGGSHSHILTVVLNFRSKSGLYHYSVNVELATFQRKFKSEFKHDSGRIRQCRSGLRHLQGQTLSCPTR